MNNKLIPERVIVGDILNTDGDIYIPVKIVRGTFTAANSSYYYEFVTAQPQCQYYAVDCRIKIKRSTVTDWEQVCVLQLFGFFGQTSSPAYDYYNNQSRRCFSNFGICYEGTTVSSSYPYPSVSLSFNDTLTYDIEIEYFRLDNMTTVDLNSMSRTSYVRATLYVSTATYGYGNSCNKSVQFANTSGYSNYTYATMFLAETALTNGDPLGVDTNNKVAKLIDSNYSFPMPIEISFAHTNTTTTAVVVVFV